MSKFIGLSLSYMIEKKDKDNQQTNEALPQYIKDMKLDSKAYDMQSRDDWVITDKNIQNELDRCNQTDVSFYVVLRWLQYEMNEHCNQKGKEKEESDDNLLSVIINKKGASSLPKLKSEQELLALCYFQYLEANQFIGFDNDKKEFINYLYGQALENGSSGLDETILVLLEMLSVFFPAG